MTNDSNKIGVDKEVANEMKSKYEEIIKKEEIKSKNNSNYDLEDNEKYIKAKDIVDELNLLISNAKTDKNIIPLEVIEGEKSYYSEKLKALSEIEENAKEGKKSNED